jgi:hypothetical protein
MRRTGRQEQRLRNMGQEEEKVCGRKNDLQGKITKFKPDL